ncbi:MAG: helix-turn-helix transcriptional regulator [Hyphomicrobium sp.]
MSDAKANSKALKLSGEESSALSLRLREELARRRITRQGLADAAKISISTLEKVLAGRRTFTLATIVRLEEGLGVKLLPSSSVNGGAAGDGTAPDALGNYARPAVQWLEGGYLTLRPSFSEKNAVYAYRTDIQWNEATASLIFREAERVDADYTQFGSVAVPHQSGHIYLVTNRHGQHRLIVVARPTIGGEMHGILTTLQSGKGAHLSPVATPIVLKHLRNGEKVHYGCIPPGHAAHAKYAGLVKKTLDEQFAAFLAG